MKNTSQSSGEVLWSKIKDSKIAMLTSICRDVELHSRPMMTAQNDFDDTLYFFSRLSSEKIDEVSHNPQVLLTYANPKEMSFVSVRGHANISRNPAKIREHWVPELDVYFDKGMNDSDLCLIEVQVSEAECWDSDYGKMTQIFGSPKPEMNSGPSFVGSHKELTM